MNRIVVGIIFFGILSLSCPAESKDQNGLYAIKGVGVFNCAGYVNAIETNSIELSQYAGYVTGYVSAYNEHRPNTFDVLPWQTVDTVMLLLLNRCRGAPTANFGTVVAGIVRFFDAGKLGEQADHVRLGTAESGIDIYVPVLEEIKRKLERRGYPTSDIEEALASFQRDEDLSADGFFGQATLLRLFYEQPPQ